MSRALDSKYYYLFLEVVEVVGHCPEVKVKLGGVDVGYLIDTGSEVSTTTEFLSQGREVIKTS